MAQATHCVNSPAPSPAGSGCRLGLIFAVDGSRFRAARSASREAANPTCANNEYPTAIMTAVSTLERGSPDQPRHQDLANAIRALAMDAVEAAKSGHPGMPMGMADVATVLFARFLRFDPERARMARPRPLRAVRRPRLDAAVRAALPDRLSAAWTWSSCGAFASSDRAPPAIPSSAMRPASRPPPDRSGRASANAVGMALAERHLRARFGADLVDHRTYVIASDGDLMEGISHEACSFAGHQRLDRLIVLFDDNRISIDGPTALAISDDTLQAVRGLWLAGRRGRRPRPRGDRSRARRGAARRSADADRVPHHDRLRRAEQGGHRRNPRLAARRRRGCRRPPAAGLARIRRSRSRPPFSRRGEASAAAAPARARPGRRVSRARPAPSWWPSSSGCTAGDLPAGLDGVLRALKQRLAEERPTWATRKASQEVLEAFTPAVPEMVGGSADLTGSVNTKAAAMAADDPGSAGRPLHPFRRARACHGGGLERHGPAPRRDPLRRHVPDLLRLLPAGDPPRRPDGPAGDPGADPRFDRSRRGRSDPSADRAPRGAAGHAEPARVPAGGCGRDRGVLGAGAGAHRRALGPGAQPPEPADGAHDGRRRQSLRPRRLHPRGGGRPAAGDPARDRLGGRDRARRPQAPPGLRRGHCRGLDALLRAVRSAGPDLSQGSAGLGAQNRDRGGIAVRLDALRTARERRRRHAQLWRLGPGRGALSSTSASRPSAWSRS